MSTIIPEREYQGDLKQYEAGSSRSGTPTRSADAKVLNLHFAVGE